MPKAIVGMVALLAVAGWVAAFHFFIRSADLSGQLEVSEADRGKFAEDLERAKIESSQYSRAKVRLNEIGQELSDTKDKLTAYERLIESKQDELIAVMSELGSLEAQLRERQAEIVLAETEPGGTEPEAKGLAQAEAGATEVTSEAETEAEPSTPELEPDSMSEAELSAAEPAPEPETEVDSSAAEAEPESMSKAEPSATGPQSEAMSEAEVRASGPEVTVNAADLVGNERAAEAERRFRIVDENGDGKVDQFEFRLNSIKLLGLIDKNDDGFVTIEETLLSREQFELFDLDGDGKISTNEFTRAFLTIDSEGKGYVTREEYLEFVQSATN